MSTVAIDISTDAKERNKETSIHVASAFLHWTEANADVIYARSI